MAPVPDFDIINDRCNGTWLKTVGEVRKQRFEKLVASEEPVSKSWIGVESIS